MKFCYFKKFKWRISRWNYYNRSKHIVFYFLL